jgi:hypothetical protein
MQIRPPLATVGFHTSLPPFVRDICGTRSHVVIFLVCSDIIYLGFVRNLLENAKNRSFTFGAISLHYSAASDHLVALQSSCACSHVNVCLPGLYSGRKS